MSESERATLEHIRRVAEAALAAVPVPESGAPGRGLALLPVPYVSQTGPGADRRANDSAGACGAMLVGAFTGQTVTPDDFYTRAAVSADVALTLPQTAAALAQYGVAVEQRSGLRLIDLYAALTLSKPVVLAVKHAVLRDAGLTAEAATGVHTLVAIGLDAEHIYVHDPLRRDQSGQAQPVPMLVLYRAWTQIGRDLSSTALERAALVPRLPLKRRVAATTVINVRSGAGTTFSQVGQLQSGDVVEVTRIQGEWGRMAEGRWISLTYTRDI
jgi:hypothetical protein